jgi:hypothetical protein
MWTLHFVRGGQPQTSAIDGNVTFSQRRKDGRQRIVKHYDDGSSISTTTCSPDIFDSDSGAQCSAYNSDNHIIAPFTPKLGTPPNIWKGKLPAHEDTHPSIVLILTYRVLARRFASWLVL